MNLKEIVGKTGTLTEILGSEAVDELTFDQVIEQGIWPCSDCGTWLPKDELDGGLFECLCKECGGEL